MNYRITEFFIEPGITGTHGNRPVTLFIISIVLIDKKGASKRPLQKAACHSFVIFKEISRLVRDLEIWKRFL